MKTKIKTITLYIFSLFFTTSISAQSLQWTFLAHPDSLQVNGLAFSKDGKFLLSGTDCHPSHIRLFNLENGLMQWNYTVGDAFMCQMGVGFSADNKYFASVEEMGNILLFDYNTNAATIRDTIYMGTQYAFSLCFSPNNQKIAVGGSNGKLQTYRISNGQADLNIPAHASFVTTVAYSPNNLMLASGGTDDKIKIWDTIGLLKFTLSGHTGDITTVKFSADNSKLISSSKDNTLKIWNALDGSLINTISVSSAQVTAFDISSDNKFLYVVSQDQMLRIFDFETNALLKTIQVSSTAQPTSVSCSNDLKLIAVGISNGVIKCYNTDLKSYILEKDSPSRNVRINFNSESNQIQVIHDVNDVLQLELLNCLGQKVFEANIVEKNATYTLKSMNSGIHYLYLSNKLNQVLDKKRIVF